MDLKLPIRDSKKATFHSPLVCRLAPLQTFAIRLLCRRCDISIKRTREICHEEKKQTLMIPKAIYSSQSIQLKYPSHTSLSLKVPCRMRPHCGNQGFRCTSLPKKEVSFADCVACTFHVSTGRSASLKDQSNFSAASGSSVGS